MPSLSLSAVFKTSGAVTGLLGLVGFAVVATSCRTRSFGERGEPGSGVNEAFDTRAARGRATVHYVAPNGTKEICVLPKHFPGVKYPKDDAEDEAKLCSLNFHKSPSSSDAGEAGALCPKLTSTFPGVEFYELDGQNKDDYEKNLCKATDRPTKRLAKFKQSVSCSFTGSILGYYHLSRILGGAGNVPVAVIRTMDVTSHKKIADRGVAFSRPGELNNTLWKQVQSMDATPKERKNYFLPDLKTVFGALSDNPAGEERYSEINRNSSDGAVAKANFLKTPEAARLFDPNGVGNFVKRDFASAAPVLQQMKDISDLMLMDYVFQQQDRFGNIHRQEYYAWLDSSGDVEMKRVKRNSSGAITSAKPDPGAVIVQRMLLKDNDCGSRPGNPKAFTEADLKALRHFSARTYKRLQFLAASFNSGEATKFFDEEALLATHDALGQEAGLSGLKSRVMTAAKVLKEQCKAGKLLLDLSIADHVASKNLPDQVKTRCDEVHVAEDDPVNQGGGGTPGVVSIPGKAVATGDTFLKATTGAAGSLSDDQKCAVKAGTTVGYSSRQVEGGHFKLTIDIPTSECSAAFLSGNVYAYADHFNFIEPRTCKVAASAANVRADPNTSADILTSLPQGESFPVEGFRNGWIQTTHAGQTAWVSASTTEEPCKSMK